MAEIMQLVESPTKRFASLREIGRGSCHSHGSDSCWALYVYVDNFEGECMWHV